MSFDEDTNLLSIKEFAVTGTKLRKSEYYDHTKEIYSMINEASYDGDIIRAAIKKGQKALISELRSDYFFTIHPRAKIIAEELTGLFNDGIDHFSELFFDDLTLLSEDNLKISFFL
jgi:hypothetical protein